MKQIQDFFALVHQSDVITYLFGITAGILTLIGFATIFVSINSQHKAEKARETYWELASLPYQFTNYKDENIGKQIFQKVNLYNNIITPVADNTARIIDWIKYSLIIVSIIWLTFIFILMASLHIVEYLFLFIVTVVVVILIGYFVWYLNTLKNVQKVADLFSVDEIFDAGNTKCEVPTLTLAGISSRLKISRQERNLYSISIGFPVPFSNFLIKPIITGVDDNKDYWNSKFINDPDPDDWVIIESSNATWWIGSPLYWYDIKQFSLPDDTVEISIQLEYNCGKGITMVFFRYISVNELKKLSRITN